jgi:Domain of unknown function (DUF4276)
MRYGIMGEDDSDVATLKVLIQRLAERHRLRCPVFSKKGYNGWAQMFRKGVAQLQLFDELQCAKVVICYDADGPEEKAKERRRKVEREIITPSKVAARCFALVPVQELEAWILADLDAVKKLITSLKVPKEFSSPERVRNPKEKLITICRCPLTRKQRYSPPQDNERVAPHLDLKVVEKKCPSFSSFVEFITDNAHGEGAGRKKKTFRKS